MALHALLEWIEEKSLSVLSVTGQKERQSRLIYAAVVLEIGECLFCLWLSSYALQHYLV